MRIIITLIAALLVVTPAFAAPPLSLLFLGDTDHHKPRERFQQLEPVLRDKSIALTYTNKLEDLNAANLAKYDGLIVYSNDTKITPEQEKALLDFVASGKGFIPLHCASYCFLNSPAYIALVGAQFRSHKTGTFAVENVQPDHAIMKGYSGFTSFDETYLHHKHNEKDRVVLEVRAEGDLKEPWTWVRTHGKGRVFYTAWGHDQRTWSHPGFHNLVERGIRWACNQDPALAGTFADRPEMTPKRTDVKPFEYVDAKIPKYVPGGNRKSPEAAGRMQKPLDPEESRKHFVTPKGFEVRTFVTEEKLGGKPLTMAWDERGRLWVSLTLDYPNELQPLGEGRDRIVICEDADGDGVCDTVSTFADKLSIPTSLLPYRGGVIVHAAPDTLFLKDTDGDGKADLRQILFTGWGTGDTHAGPSNLRYGFDNWIYGIVGYSGFKGIVNGEAIQFKQGFYRFKVDLASGGRKPPEGKANHASLQVSKLEFLRSTSNNSWGVGFSEDGQLFGSTANGCPLVHLTIPNRYYEKVHGLTPSVLPSIAADNHIEPITEAVRQVDWHGGFTAAAGCSLYTARVYPKEYWNRVSFVCEPTGHLVAAMILEPDGATYKARYGWNLLASDDEWSAPIQAEVGPDGQVWVIDWYNFIVQHNPTPAGFNTGKGNAYETPLRDKTRGRIYRVVYTDGKPEPKVNLKDATPEKLIETLKHPNMGWRQHAQRLLVERGNTDTISKLTELLSETKSNEIQSIHALGILQEADSRVWPSVKSGESKPITDQDVKLHDQISKSISSSMSHSDTSVRKIAYAMAGGMERLSGVFESLPKGLSEADAGARFAAILALADYGFMGASGTIASKPIIQNITDSQRVKDSNLSTALTIAAIAHAGSFTASLSSQSFPSESLPIIELAAAEDVRVVGSGDFIKIRFETVREAKPEVQEAIIKGYNAGWPRNEVPGLTNTDVKYIIETLKLLQPRSKAKLLHLIRNWNIANLEGEIADFTKTLYTATTDASITDEARLEAARQIIDLLPEDEAALAKLLAVISPQSSPGLATGIFDALAASNAKSLGVSILAKLKDVPPSSRPAALRLVLGRTDSAKAFLDAVEAGQVRFDMLSLDQKNALASHPTKAIAERARKLLELGGGLPNADRQKVIAELAHVLTKTGSVDAGKKVFLQHCAKCHKHGSDGAAIGPDLTGFGTHPKEEILIHLLDPSRSVEGNFKAYRAVTADGRVILGLLASESKTAIEMVDAEGKRHALSRDNLESLTESDKSLMPEGFEKQAKPEELVDLLEFLTQKGKWVPLPLDRVATIVSTRGMFHSEEASVERLILPDWKPRTVEGVPFVFVDPQGEKVKNVILLQGPGGKVSAEMPTSASVACNTSAKAIHLLSGVGGWNATKPRDGKPCLVVTLHYADGKKETHTLKDGLHFADYIRRVDVPGSKFAFMMRGQQMRYLTLEPKRKETIKTIEFAKGEDRSSPIVMAVTVETP